MDPILTEVLPTPDSKPIRRFTDSGVQKAIDDALATLDTGQHGAVVAHVYGDGAALTAVAKLGDHWSVVAAAFKPWTGAISGEGAVRYQW